MPVALRIVAEKMLNVKAAWLNPRIGCGLMLANLPRYDANDVLRDVMREYGYTNINADKAAVKFLDGNESLLRTFCGNAEDARLEIKPNFRMVFAGKDVYLVLDLEARTAYFLAAPENRLTLNNYYRDAVAAMMQELKIALSGSTSRLTSVGWQNLNDLVAETNFRFTLPEVERIEVMSTLPAARWRKPVLEIGLNLLNLSDPKSIHQAVVNETKPKL
jgi:hypothetical protein